MDENIRYDFSFQLKIDLKNVFLIYFLGSRMKTECI